MGYHFLLFLVLLSVFKRELGSYGHYVDMIFLIET